MKKKIIGIIACILLVTTTLPGLSIKIKDKIDNACIEDHSSSPLQWWWGIDQEQTSHCGRGMQIRPPFVLAQSFIPSKKKLTAVQLYIYMKGNPNWNGYINFTVNVTKALTENNLTGASEPSDNIEKDGTWVWFDLPNINVIPGEKYYIIIRCDGGNDTDCFYWYYNINDKYGKGDAWISYDNGSTWMTLWEFWQYDPQFPEPDFCFKTYFIKSKNTSNMFNIQILDRLFERFPHAFQILRYVLEYSK